MDRRLKKALPLLGALVFLMVGAALAVPTFNLDVQSIGEGGPQSLTVPGGVTTATINWVLDSNNPDYIAGVKIKFDQDLSSGTNITVKLYGSSGLLDSTYTVLNSDLTAGTEVELTFASTHEIGTVDKVAVVLVGPEK